MWIDDDGVVHTVALPSPTELMSAGFRGSLDALVEVDSRRVLDLVESQQDRFLSVENVSPIDADTEARFHGATPPRNLLDGPVSTLDDLGAVIAAVDRRWRLDVLMALEDYLT